MKGTTISPIETFGQARRVGLEQLVTEELKNDNQIIQDTEDYLEQIKNEPIPRQM
jgi:hypothetical protein